MALFLMLVAASAQAQSAIVTSVTISPSSIVGFSDDSAQFMVSIQRIQATPETSILFQTARSGSAVSISGLPSPGIVGAFQDSATFTIFAGVVSQPETVTITVTVGSSIASATLTVLPHDLSVSAGGSVD